MKKILVANRGEIAIRIFRACSEMGISTVAIYALEEKGAVHRFKADEAYLIGEGKKPVDAYLDIESIIDVAKDAGVDGIHPGYGFLSENVEFARRCQEEGIKFIGPDLKHLEMFGDKIKSKEAAENAGLKNVPSSEGTVSLEEVYDFADEAGYPLLIKAVAGGGGRGMRIVRSREEIADQYKAASREAEAAFGNPEVFVERYLEDPRHIEVQILGDEFGNVIHLWERDCSVQRRHQKVVEVAPAVGLSEELRLKICNDARSFMDQIGYINAGTVEFLLDGEDFYFMEVNPRIQVEHTITELITDVDIVQAQIRIANGANLNKDLGLPLDKPIETRNFSIQCRITTEDPENDFMPDTGRINTYRSPGGFGIRLDAGDGFQGTVVQPYFDSMLAKLCTYGPTFEDACDKMTRALAEFRIRGVKNNIPFLKKVVGHPEFQSGEAPTTFIDNTPDLFKFDKPLNRGNKILEYIGETTINGFPGLDSTHKPYFENAEISEDYNPPLWTVEKPKHILDKEGPQAVSKWLMDQKRVLFTDTTFRDAHQSLLATRVRTNDMIKSAKYMEDAFPYLFSMEVWGGATFDTAFRYLNEDPWERLRLFRKAMPNTLLQMLFRGSNAVGYSVYPDNVLEAFIKKAAEIGVDVFRIFDSLNWFDQIERSLHYVKESGKIAEAAICYTSDIFDEKRPTYSLKYYTDLAKKLEKAGADILCIKDMAGLLKPSAAYTLISELKDTLEIPVHLHTHDTANVGTSTYQAAVSAEVDVIDTAIDAMGSRTSQPAMGSTYYAIEGKENEPLLDLENMAKINTYWTDVRKYYVGFENEIDAPLVNVYQHEMPGGQYTNLQQQAKSVGLGDRWDEIMKVYHDVNLLFGDIVKVTPSSKVVGDMTLFMVQNDVTKENFFEKASDLDFPTSVVEFFQGKLGQPAGGFPEDVREAILKGRDYITVRPGSMVEPVDFDQVRRSLEEKLPSKNFTDEDILSYLMYPEVFEDYCASSSRFGDVSNLPTPVFFYGLDEGESTEIEIEKGKVLYIKLLQISEPNHEGVRHVNFELNGQPRTIDITDLSYGAHVAAKEKADLSNPKHVGATMPGSVVTIMVEVGDEVETGQSVIVTEAMKMETTLHTKTGGTVKAIHTNEGDSIETGDLLIEIV